ncbi:MAG: glycoside hydrolase [Verrucomicrobiales bacterium]|nr:glycoside hydrolase [Verrucomicrobiales bacterium]
MWRTVFFVWSLASLAVANDNLVSNPGFENGLADWRELWNQEPGSGQISLDSKNVHSGNHAARIEHRGSQDWNLEPAVRVSVREGDVCEWTVWLKRNPVNHGRVAICASTWGKDGKVRDWFFGEQMLSPTADWQLARAWFVVPPGVEELQPRIVGNGVADLWVDDAALVKRYNLNTRRAEAKQETATIANETLEVSVNPTDAAISVLDRRNQQRYVPLPLMTRAVLVTGLKVTDKQIRCEFFSFSNDLAISAVIRLDANRPEFTVELTANGELRQPLRYPAPFAVQDDDYLVLPLNEGISYPVHDPDVEPMWLPAYSGHGLCMAFYGDTNGKRGCMNIIETPDDAAIRLVRHDGKLNLEPEWSAQHGQFGYARRLRYVFFDQGGHVAMAKRYREYAKQVGLFKTLEQKRQENPNVDKLIGAVNVWNWDGNAPGMAKEMQAAGIQRILWSNGEPPDDIRKLNDLGALTSRYDIYQDIMDPKLYPLLKENSPFWIAEAWPDGVMHDANGEFVKGWEIEGKDGKMHPCGALSDVLAPDYARRRIAEDLKTRPFNCRFIDTTTASPWREDYSPAHPMTRSDSKRWKMELLRLVSQDFKLVTGSETGHDAAVPYVDYFEGMMSLAPYRVPDSGRAMMKIWHEVPPDVAKYQLGEAYRLPLWELVYHDCMVSYWYWGDYNNKLPSLWDKRDLFNILYGTPPMFMFDRKLWNENRDRFVRSYRNICPLVREVGYSKMTDHRFLTPDRAVQQTVFANGTTVTVNFGATPYQPANGESIASMGFKISPGIGKR